MYGLEEASGGRFVWDGGCKCSTGNRLSLVERSATCGCLLWSLYEHYQVCGMRLIEMQLYHQACGVGLTRTHLEAVLYQVVQRRRLQPCPHGLAVVEHLGCRGETQC